MAEIWNNSSVLRQGSCALAASKQRQVTLEEVSSSFLFGCSSKSFMERTTCSSCALCALCNCRQASLYTAQPHPHCFRRHKEGAGAGSTSSSAVSLTTNDNYGKGYGKVEQRRHLQPRLIGDRIASPIAVQRARRLFGTRTGWGVRVHVAESCAKRPTASRWWTRRSLKWCMSKLGKFSLQVTTVLWMLFRTRLTKKRLFQTRKFAQSGLREVLTLQSSLSSKAAVGASMLCLRKQGQPSPGFVWEWWAGRRSVCQPRDDLPCCKAYSRILWSCRFKRYACPNQLVCFRAQTPIASRNYHEFKQKLFDVVNYSVK